MTVFVNQDSSQKGLLSMDVAQVKLLFTLYYCQHCCQCTLVHWFQHDKDTPDQQAGMWVIKLCMRYCVPVCSVINLATIFCMTHLIPVYDTKDPIPNTANHTASLGDYQKFYVNKYIDHHAFDVLHC